MQIRLAERQHGVISRAQLVALGFTRHRIDGLIGRWLHPVYRGVYSVGTRRVTPRGGWMAAVLASGEGAVLSHRAAAALWSLIKARPRLPALTVPRPRRPRDGIELHYGPLPGDEWTVLDGIPVTTVPRTIFDLAAVATRREAERALDEAEYLRLWDALSLHDLIARHPNGPGCATIRAILDAREPSGRTRSDLEELFRAFLKSRNLPLPQTNYPVEKRTGEWVEADCVWPEARLIIELDGRQAHATRSRFDGDRSRDRALAMAGWTVWRVTEHHLRQEADELDADLRARLGGC